MNVLTKVVFPALRLIVWLVIAAALVKIGFFPATDDAPDDVIDPGSDFGAPTTFVERATIRDDISAPATVIADPARDVKTDVSGYVGYWARAEGATVSAGQPIVEVRRPIEGSPTGAWTRHTLEAPIGGILHRSVPLNGDVNGGDVVFTVTPTTMSVEATLTPEQRYRLVENPTSASVRLQGGPVPFTCDRLTFGAATAGGGDNGDGGDGGDGGGDTSSFKMTCPAPADIRLVVGLSGTMVVPASEAADILAIPITAVQTTDITSVVFKIDPMTGEQVQVEVSLGISDGTIIEVVSGLEEGEEILMFAPGNLEPLPEEPWVDDGFVDEEMGGDGVIEEEMGDEGVTGDEG